MASRFECLEDGIKRVAPMRGRGYFFWWTLPIANWHPRLSTSASFVAVHNESQIAICADALAFLRRSDPRQRERRGKPSDVMTQKTTACSRCCSKRRQTIEFRLSAVMISIQITLSMAVSPRNLRQTPCFLLETCVLSDT